MRGGQLAGDLVVRNEWAQYFEGLRDNWLFLDAGTGSQRGVIVYDITARRKRVDVTGEIAGWRDARTLLLWIITDAVATRGQCPRIPQQWQAGIDSLVAIDLPSGAKQSLGRWRCAYRE